MGVACRLARPDGRGVNRALEGGIEAAIPIELQPAADVLEGAAHPGDHHVPRPKLGAGVPRLENPAGHSLTGSDYAFFLATNTGISLMPRTAS